MKNKKTKKQKQKEASFSTKRILQGAVFEEAKNWEIKRSVMRLPLTGSKEEGNEAVPRGIRSSSVPFEVHVMGGEEELGLKSTLLILGLFQLKKGAGNTTC